MLHKQYSWLNSIDKISLRRYCSLANAIARLLHESWERFYSVPAPNAETSPADATKIKRMYVVDAGLEFNSPYPPLLRPQRAVDMYFSFEFSARKKDFEENRLKVL